MAVEQPVAAQRGDGGGRRRQCLSGVVHGSCWCLRQGRRRGNVHLAAQANYRATDALLKAQKAMEETTAAEQEEYVRQLREQQQKAGQVRSASGRNA